MAAYPDLLNQPVDISRDFFDPDQDFFLARRITRFDPDSGTGLLRWHFHRRVNDRAFGKIGQRLKEFTDREIFWKDLEVHPECPFSLRFLGPGTIRLRLATSSSLPGELPSPMLEGTPAYQGGWSLSESEGRWIFTSDEGQLILGGDPFSLELRDAGGRLLTRVLGPEVQEDPHPKTLPLLFLQRGSDDTRSILASFSLLPGEKICGCGESFTSLDKRGQKLVLFTTDTQSVQTGAMYKPVPFFISSRGHGLFLHTSAPVTMDLGQHFDGSKLLFCGEDHLDLFLFLGDPAAILDRYTSLTGKSPLPPLWSFGLWMSRFSYRSQEEVASIAAGLRTNRIPCDVIHIDAGWFRSGVNCDFSFDPDRFPDPAEMVRDLKAGGFRISAWQLPFFTRGNPIFDELVEKKLFIRDPRGGPPADEAMPDLSLPAALEWYRSKIKPLLDLGISVIKADFGEGAPYRGLYGSGRTGFHEHNLYPLRYTGFLSGLTRELTGEPVIWARSAWAGGQRYPVHWAGDSEATDNGMASTLRGGLSLGLSGFSFWSHDIGGFFGAPSEDLLLRWSFFGLLSSHSRLHGIAPREPWLLSPPGLKVFRSMVNLRYQLMPYLFTQAAVASGAGLPMLKPLLLNYPGDPTAWMISDEYLLGNDLLVAPLMEGGLDRRQVYLPAGRWIDWQDGRTYEGQRWELIHAGQMPGILLVREGSLIPQVATAQDTSSIDWSSLELVAFAQREASGDYYDPMSRELVRIRASKTAGKWATVGQKASSYIVLSHEEAGLQGFGDRSGH